MISEFRIGVYGEFDWRLGWAWCPQMAWIPTEIPTLGRSEPDSVEMSEMMCQGSSTLLHHAMICEAGSMCRRLRVYTNR